MGCHRLLLNTNIRCDKKTLNSTEITATVCQVYLSLNQHIDNFQHDLEYLKVWFYLKFQFNRLII